MKKAKLLGLGAVAMTALFALGACGGNKGGNSSGDSGKTDEKHSVAIVTDIGGVDDRSFNQSAWEGLKVWGKEHKFKRGVGGYDYIQSNDASQYTQNIDSVVQNKYKTVFGIGYLLADPISTAADQNADTNFVIIDSVIEGKKNVVSATFKDNEAAYLAGVAAAHTTKTKKIGFVGGEEGAVIDRFEAGFTKGIQDAAKEMGTTITVDVQYAASFGDPAKGKSLAANMYNNGADIIYHASGGTGNGVFSEAKARNEKADEKDKVWVVGVDSDQSKEGKYKDKNGKESNFCLTSSLKGVGAAVQDLSTRALKDKFPGGEHLTYGLKDGGVSLTDGQLSDQAKEAVKKAKDKIISGDIKVPEKPTK